MSILKMFLTNNNFSNVFQKQQFEKTKQRNIDIFLLIYGIFPNFGIYYSLAIKLFSCL